MKRYLVKRFGFRRTLKFGGNDHKTKFKTKEMLMITSLRFGRPVEAQAVVQNLQLGLDPTDDEWHNLDSLFDSDRLDWADEAVFMTDKDGTVLALGLICRPHPCVVSYYTLPSHRCKGYGYALLRACIRRIIEVSPHGTILIESSNKTVDNHIALLPDEYRRMLHVR